MPPYCDRSRRHARRRPPWAARTAKAAKAGAKHGFHMYATAKPEASPNAHTTTRMHTAAASADQRGTTPSPKGSSTIRPERASSKSRLPELKISSVTRVENCSAGDPGTSVAADREVRPPPPARPVTSAAARCPHAAGGDCATAPGPLCICSQNAALLSDRGALLAQSVEAGRTK